VLTELFLLRRDERGLRTLFWGDTRHDWQQDTLDSPGLYDATRESSRPSLPARSTRCTRSPLSQSAGRSNTTVGSNTSSEVAEPRRSRSGGLVAAIHNPLEAPRPLD
jgi:hypothetical protein